MGRGGVITMPAQHRDVCQPSVMDDSIVYRSNPNRGFGVGYSHLR